MPLCGIWLKVVAKAAVVDDLEQCGIKENVVSTDLNPAVGMKVLGLWGVDLVLVPHLDEEDWLTRQEEGQIRHAAGTGARPTTVAKDLVNLEVGKCELEITKFTSEAKERPGSCFG